MTELPELPAYVSVSVFNDPVSWDTKIAVWQAGQPTSGVLTQSAITHTWDLWGKPEGAIGEFIGALYAALCNGVVIDAVIAKYDIVSF